MIDISVNELVKSFEVGQTLLDGLSFDIHEGECVGIMGRNGCGKTTLFRLLTGELSPDSGEIHIAAGKKLGLISQIPVYPAGFSVEDVLRTAFAALASLKRRMEELEKTLEKDASRANLSEYDRLSNAYLTGGGYEQDTEVDKVCNGLGIPAEMRGREFDRLSGGEKTRVNLGRLILEDTDILLLDEPTNHLDLQATEWLEEYVRGFHGTVVTISHDRYFLDRTVTRIVEIENGKAEFYSGNYSFYAIEKERRYQERMKQYLKEQAKIAQLEKAADQMHLWAFMGNDALHKRAFSMEKRIERMRTTERPTKARRLDARFTSREFRGDEVMQVKNLSKSFGERTLFSEIYLRVEPGERIALLGENGTGKTTLLRILCGESLPDAGDAAFGTGVTTGYLEQNARLDPSLDIYATMRLVFTPALDAMQEMDALQKQLAADPHNAELTEKIAHCTAVIDAMDAYNMDTQIKKVLNGMGFPADTWTKLAGVLSGGEQTRLRLARLLLERPDLLILDEPTNHLDLETMEWLENYLKAYRGAVLVVSHDRYFLDAVCTRIWELRGKSIKTYRGNYSAYLPQREAADERQQKLHDAAVEKAAKLQDYVDRNLVRASTTKMAQSRRKQLEKLEIVEAPTSEAWELNFRFEYDIEPYDELVIMKNLSVHIGERTLIDALDYVVHRGDKLVIAGPNGAGKSTLLQVLDGKRRPSGGMVRLGSGAKPGVFTQQQARRAGRVIDAIWNQYPRFTELEVRSHLARFGYRGEEVFKDCASLSGGELARLRFAELALERPNLMFLDEPTNHLDIYMR